MRPAIPAKMIRPIEVRAFDMTAGQSFQPHVHDWAQFSFSAQGVITVLTEEGHFTAPPSMGVWLPPGVSHDINAVGAAQFRSLYIDESQIRGMPDNCMVFMVDDLLRELILQAARLPRAWDLKGADYRLMRVLLDRLRCAHPAPLHLPLPDDLRLRAVTDRLLKEPANRQTLAEHGEQVGASARTLARLFKEETGMTFGEWRRQRILLASLEQLAAGMAVNRVALEMGYDSPSAFIAMFKQCLGVTPVQYLANTSA